MEPDASSQGLVNPDGDSSIESVKRVEREITYLSLDEALSKRLDLNKITNLN
jgi:hypothetical protein